MLERKTLLLDEMGSRGRVNARYVQESGPPRQGKDGGLPLTPHVTRTGPAPMRAARGVTLARKTGNLAGLERLAGRVLGLETSYLFVRDDETPDEPYCVIVKDPTDSGPMIALMRPGQEHEDIAVKTIPGGPMGVSLQRPETQSHAQLNVMADGRPGIVLGTAGAVEALLLMVDPDTGAPEIQLRDRSGATRAELWL